MKLTLKKYRQAKALVEKAKAQLAMVKQWEEAVKKVGNVGNNRIVALTINNDGSVQATVESNGFGKEKSDERNANT